MRVTYINSRGQSLEFTPNRFKLISIEGLGDVEAEFQSQKAPYQDGSTYIDSILEERTIPIELMIYGKDYNELTANRRYISSVFNPKTGLGELSIELAGRRFIINPVSDFVPKFLSGKENMGSTFQRCQVQVTAPDPYWKDPQEVSRALRAYQGTFSFPFSFPVQFGISGDTTYLWNEGDVEAPVTIDIQGPVTNPRVINKTTGQYIRVNRSLSADEVLHINTNDQNKRVEIYRDGATIEKAIGYLEHYSDFWKLAPGRNEVQYIADAGNADAIVAVAWHSHYVGI